MTKKKSNILTLLLVILLLIINSNTFSQIKKKNSPEYNYKKFKEEFSKEFNDYEENNNTIRDTKSIFQKIDLPEWFFCPPLSNDKIIYAIGISDPEMNKDTAMFLAEIRAKAITAFLNNSNIKGLSDNYSNERKLEQSDTYSTLFGEFFNIKSNLDFDTANFNIEKCFFTDYNEAIILSSYCVNTNNQEKNKTANFNAEIFNIKKKAKKSHQINSIININSKISDLKNKTNIFFKYKTKSSGKSNKIYSEYSGGKKNITNNNYRYKNSKNTETKKNTKKSLSNGLWNAYISALMQDIIFSIEDYKLTIENMNDNYTQKNQNITRQKLEKNISAKIKKIIIKNNKLIIEADVKKTN